MIVQFMSQMMEVLKISCPHFVYAYIYNKQTSYVDTKSKEKVQSQPHSNIHGLISVPVMYVDFYPI